MKFDGTEDDFQNFAIWGLGNLMGIVKKFVKLRFNRLTDNIYM